MTSPTDPPTAPASLPNYLADGLPRQSDKTLEDVREYVEEERSLQKRREERRREREQASILTRAKWWFVGRPAEDTAES